MRLERLARWASLGRVLLFMLGCVIVLIAASAISKQMPQLPPAIVVGGLGTLATFALSVMFLRWDGRRLADAGLAFGRGSLRRFAIGVLVGFALVALHMAIMAGVGHVRWHARSFEGAGAFAVVALGYLVLSCREELAFRGYPLRILATDFGPWPAQCLVAAIFAGEHILGGAGWVNAIVGAGLGALVFGMAALATRGLALPIGLHAAWNLGDWAHGGKGEGGLWIAVITPGRESEAGTMAMAGYAVVMALAFVLLWRVGRHRRTTGSLQ